MGELLRGFNPFGRAWRGREPDRRYGSNNTTNNNADNHNDNHHHHDNDTKNDNNLPDY